MLLLELGIVEFFIVELFGMLLCILTGCVCGRLDMLRVRYLMRSAWNSRENRISAHHCCDRREYPQLLLPCEHYWYGFQPSQRLVSRWMPWWLRQRRIPLCLPLRFEQQAPCPLLGNDQRLSADWTYIKTAWSVYIHGRRIVGGLNPLHCGITYIAPPPRETWRVAVERARRAAGEVFFKKGHTALLCLNTTMSIILIPVVVKLLMVGNEIIEGKLTKLRRERCARVGASWRFLVCRDLNCRGEILKCLDWSGSPQLPNSEAWLVGISTISRLLPK